MPRWAHRTAPLFAGQDGPGERGTGCGDREGLLPGALHGVGQGGVREDRVQGTLGGLHRSLLGSTHGD